MIGLREIVIVSLLGLLTTSSSIVGAALGLYVPLSKRDLACVLAFAAGALISGLAIELAFEGAKELHRQGFDANAAWAFISTGFALGAIIYYFTSLFLDQMGPRYATRRGFANMSWDASKRMRSKPSNCCRNAIPASFPAQEVEGILPCVRTRHLNDGEILFHAGDAGDALYIVAEGKVDVCRPWRASRAMDTRPEKSSRNWVKGKHSARWPSGKIFIGSGSHVAVFFRAVAGARCSP